MSRKYRIQIREGLFGNNFGRNFNIGSGGGVNLGLLLSLIGKKKLKKKGKNSLAYLLKLLDTVQLVDLIGQASD